MPASLTVSQGSAASQGKDPLLRFALICEIAVAFACLVLFTEGLLPRLFASEENPESGFLRLLWLPVYGLVGMGALWKLPQMFRAALRMPFLLFILLLACASVAWSINPEVTERRAVAIVATTLAGFYLAVRYDWRTLLRLLGAVWIFLAFISLGAGLAAPGFGIMDEVHVGAWRGLWWEKNAMGGHMARAAFLCAFLFLMDKPWRMVWGGGVLLCAALVILSTSKTALLGLMLGFGVLAGAAWMRRGPVTTISSIWLGVILVGAFATVMVVEPGLVFQLLGRDATLTGRTDIWAVLIDAIGQRPLFGYGYAAFWGAESQPAYMVRLATEWLVPTAHNGWLETALSIGLVGLAGFAICYLVMLWRSVLLAFRSWNGVFACGVALQFLLFSLSESIALQQNAIVWVTFVAVAVKVAIPQRAASREPKREQVSAVRGERLARMAARPAIVRIR
ncbi:O-antigen ligase [Henriciella sp. AS95]|uniref:O-antigen ligase family protein n=1 Tax=Henriciella sp. AS95 TaxID=3135782 RepID=UPI00317285DB